MLMPQRLLITLCRFGPTLFPHTKVLHSCRYCRETRRRRIRPDFVPAHQSLAQLSLLQGDKEKAMEHYQEAQRLTQQTRSIPADGPAPLLP
jgi:hypothetical protein